jgi:uncharacterized protein YjbI with pentapeptide repeats
MPIIMLTRLDGSKIAEGDYSSLRAAVEANLKNLRGADLRGADLIGAYLIGAYLIGAYLIGAEFGDGARWECGTLLTRPPLQLLGLRWPVVIGEGAVRIGCQVHAPAVWAAFSDAEIARMDSDAPVFWRQHKATILGLAAGHDANSRALPGSIHDILRAPDRS